MRIALLGSRGIPAHHGGFETFAEGLAVRLVEEGHVVTVYCEGRRGGRARSHRGVHLVYVPVPAGGCLRPLLYDLFSLAHASLGHDVVYLLGYGAALFGIIPRLLRRRLWINMDGIEWMRAKWSPLARLWFRLMERTAMVVASKIIFDAESLRDNLVGRLGEPRDSAVLPYAAEPRIAPPDHAILDSLGLEVGAYHLVVCRMEPENHILELIQGHAQAGLRRPLVIVADQSGKGAYAQRCLRASGPGVRWLGTVWDQNKLSSLRAGAFSYLHGHSVGGTNPSLLEAMACGNFCIAHDNPFNREVLEDSGIFFRGATGAARALRIAEAMSNEERQLRARMGRVRIAARYSWEGLLKAYVAVLEGREAVPAVVALPELASPTSLHLEGESRAEESKEVA